MRKICLSVLGLFINFLVSFGQNSHDSSNYKSRKLTFEEANLVTSYYRQDGNNSAVTGGVGSESLNDFSTTIDLKFVRYGKNDVKHTLNFEIVFDHYTSASSDKIDPTTISSASHADTRIYPSINWMCENATKGTTFGAGISFSNEYDYTSFGINALFAKKTNNKTGEFTASLQAYLDQLKYILPIELRPNAGSGRDDDDDDYPIKSRNSYSGSLSYSQIINQRLQLMLIADAVYQQGFLAMPFHRVFFNNNTEKIENLPDTRLKIPLGLRVNYFMGDKIILRSFYRYYIDDWGLNAHTLQIETSVKASPFISITPFYRYYTQNAVDYFAPIKLHQTNEQFYTSDYDLSKFNSHFFGAGLRLTPQSGVLHVQKISALEIRYGHYNRSNGLNSDIISMNFQFKN